MSKPLIDFHFDFETRSELDISKVASVRYATHPSTEATLLTWAFGRTGKVKAWRKGTPIPDELYSVIRSPHLYNFIAFNVAFDFMIWTIPFINKVAVPQGINAVRPKVENVTGCEALSLHFRMGSSLDKLATMLDIPIRKDKEGRQLMLKQCKISAKTNSFTELTAEEWVKFERYGIIDTVILRECYYKLPPLPRAERWIFEWTFKRNLTGIKIDTDLINALDDIVQHYLPQFKAEFMKITGCKVNSVKAKDYFLPHFPWIENMRADTVRDMQLRTEGVNPVAIRALEIKALAGSTSIAKVSCAKLMTLNGRIYDLFSYHMAQTKRFAGKGIQIHNFPRPNHKPKDLLPENLDVADLASEVRARMHTLKDPLGFVKDLLRRIWLAEHGEYLYCGDFSKVEPTMMRWMLGLGPVSKTAYEEMAVHIYSKQLHEISKDSEERQIGKAAELGCVAEDTLVRVSSPDMVYYKKIQDITLEDEVWDGEEWVSHDGVSVNGMKSVIKMAKLNIESTPDHLFLTSQGWLTAIEVNSTEDILLLKKGTYSEGGQLQGQSLRKVSRDISLCAAYVGLNRLFESISSGQVKPGLASHVLNHLGPELIQSPTLVATWLQTGGFAGVGMLASTTLGKGVRILKTKTGTVMEVEELDVTLSPFAYFWNMSLRWMGLTNGGSRLTGRIMMDTMSPETYELLVSQSTTEIKAVYDIKNCGPNSRYMLREGIAHNCGYGMGHVKFKAEVAKNIGVPMTLEFSKHVITTYRTNNPEITKFWRDLQSAFRKAINGEGSALCNRKVFVMPMQPPYKGVQIKLPSGSYLYYHKAEVRIEMKTREIVEVVNNQTVVRKITKPEETLSYLMDKDGRVVRSTVYGGLLCEHVTSATARDLLTHAMYNLDVAGFNPSVNIHDEIWGGSVPGREDEFERTMCILPYWCQDLVITADTGAGVRYLK